MSLAPCTKCKRFARPRNACPFCGGAVESRAAKTSTHLSRAALIAVAAIGCGGGQQQVQLYGAPPMPVTPDDAGGNTIAPPMDDAGVSVSPQPTIAPLYGAVPPQK